jgi:hypothetical protein
MKGSLAAFLRNAARIMVTAEMAAAMLIFAASSLLVLSRFGSLGEMASHTTKQAEQLMNQGQRAFNTVQFGLTGEAPQPTKLQAVSSDALAQPPQAQASPDSKTQADGKNEHQPENQRRLQHRKK